MTGGHKKRQKSKGKASKPTIKIPSTPMGAPKSMSTSPADDKNASAQDPQSSLASPSPFRTPPTSPSTPAPDLLPMASVPEQHSLQDPIIAAEDIASPEILAIADVFATMKSALVSMTSAFDHLGAQTDKLMEIATDTKATQQVRRIEI